MMKLSVEFYNFACKQIDIARVQMERAGSRGPWKIHLSDRKLYRSEEGLVLPWHTFLFGLPVSPTNFRIRDRSAWKANNMLVPFDQLRRDYVRTKGIYLIIRGENPLNCDAEIWTRDAIAYKARTWVVEKHGRQLTCLSEKLNWHSYNSIPF